MRAFIQKSDEGEFISEPCYVAYFGFAQMGWEIVPFKDIPPEGLSRQDVVVGWIGSVRTALKNLGITPPEEIDYPEEIRQYLGRRVWRSTMHTVTAQDDKWPLFVKSVKGKAIDGFVCDSIKSLVGRGAQEDFDVWCSDVVDFAAEYRCFIRYGKVMDVRRYKGDWRHALDRETVERCVKDYTSAPAAYSLDFGVARDSSGRGIDGRTLLVEANDGYAMGSYGLFANSYAKLISARWHELVNIPDPCQF